MTETGGSRQGRLAIYVGTCVSRARRVALIAGAMVLGVAFSACGGDGGGNASGGDGAHGNEVKRESGKSKPSYENSSGRGQGSGSDSASSGAGSKFPPDTAVIVSLYENDGSGPYDNEMTFAEMQDRCLDENEEFKRRIESWGGEVTHEGMTTLPYVVKDDSTFQEHEYTCSS